MIRMTIATEVLICLAASAGAADQRAVDRQAGAIFAESGVQGGLVVHLGCGDGQLTAALRPNERYLVRGFDPHPGQVEAARRHIDACGSYGPVSVERCDEPILPLADHAVNLLVVSRNETEVPFSEMLRVLAPRGAVLLAAAATPPIVAGQPRTDRVTIDDQPWIIFRKPWPANIDEWSHWLHGADGNPVARDTVVGPPRRVQWWASPVWSRSHEKSPSLTGMVSAGGRVFYICDEAPADIGGPLPDRWQLVARDAFSGVLLWKLPILDWGWRAWSPQQPMNLRWGNPRFIHRRLVADGERVYVTLGYSAPVTALDAATGRVVRVYAGTENTGEILQHQGRLVLSVATEPKTAIDRSPALQIVSVDAASGEQVWRAGPLASLFDLGERGKENVLKQGHLMIAADDEHVYCVTDEEVLAFRFRDGSPAWRVARPAADARVGTAAIRTDELKRWSNLGSLMVQDGRVYYAQPLPAARKLVNNVPMTLLCLAAETGEERWRRICGDWSYTTSLNAYSAGVLVRVTNVQEMTLCPPPKESLPL